ncbi:MAG: peptide deformylase [Proteobacteria bacterium]|jgi:peptide deformylase|nr:peptide deformylase [Pseudomonadota bacterium]MDA1299893.1 peptide deformylase [Pseudomonadota bacterium]
MAVRQVLRMGHPTLRTPAAPYPVDQIATRNFRTLVQDMRDTLHDCSGIGLAAPQIDVPFQVAVIEIEAGRTRYGELQGSPFQVYVNPVITVLDGQDPAGYWEGCLSIPGIRGYVTRPQHIRVDYLDENGKARSIDASGFLATVFQHEFDHLEGRLFIDRIDDTKLLAFDAEFEAFHLAR